ncbi:anti-phage defense ZorAB system ZorA [Desulforhopalus vacuolatus]|uniref:anti-phage ZorAB system protein ZorA n=1 Tax=Desulforhopalus vacuolatus TaxID=40414 RepID=UPI0019641AAF|nr:anti-phage ZorAB system protein ZorA [Desulforhopalus vacuolatus]MBM9520104.1 anti-phage defense ZorAB system ZorA [Desulforhopalus vacuolatus]
MPSQALDWWSFWPGWDHILSFDFTTTDGVTAFFIGLIILTFFLFFFSSLVISCGYWVRVRFYLKGLKDVSKNNAINKRRVLVQREADAVEKTPWWNKIVSTRLWQEFDETLVEHNEKLYSNIDAEYFFNGGTLARRIVESRLFPTGASILTGLGVLGTFLGLQLGLTGLNLDGDVTKIQGEIKLLAQSASVAFITSVWGVSSSLVLNLFEKYFHGYIKRRIYLLQCRIDNIFPRFQPVDVFLDIRSNGKKSCDALNELAEQIGSRMQESMDSFSQEITGSIAKDISQAANDISTAIGGTLKQVIEDSLVPSIARMADVSKDLADRQAKGSEDTMANLLQQFMTEMGREGEGQRDAMRTAAEEIQEAMSGLTGSMDGFFQSLKDQQAALGSEQAERTRVLETAGQRLLQRQDDAQSETSQKIAEMLHDFLTKMGDTQKEQAGSLEKVSGGVRETINELGGQISSFIQTLDGLQMKIREEQDTRSHTLEGLVQDTVTATKSILDQGESLQTYVGDSQKAMDSVVSHLDKTGDALASATSNLKTLGTEIGQSVEHAASSIEKSISLAEQQFTENSTVARNLERTLQSLGALRASISDATEDMATAAGESRQSYDSLAGHYRDIQNSMHEQINNLQEQVAQLLQNYSDQVGSQVADRMSSWDSQTKNFCDHMTSAVQAMGEVVDNIEMRNDDGQRRKK